MSVYLALDEQLRKLQGGRQVSVCDSDLHWSSELLYRAQRGFLEEGKICLFNYHKLEQSSGAEVANARELVAFLAPLFLPLIQIKDKCKC